MRTRLLAALTAAVLLGTAGTAAAVHWPYFGGDAGRSGLQPVDEGVTPVTSVYSLTDPAQRDVVTPVLTTAGGGPAAQRIIFGTEDPQGRGRVHLRVLATGAPVGDPAGVVVDQADGGGDPFEQAGDGFADSSTASALGQVFVVHNDTGPGSEPDIEIAQIDEGDGSLVKEFDVPGTDGVGIRSSAVLTGPDATGGRVLFFVGTNGEVFRVPISAAATKDASFGTVARTTAAEATQSASPALVNLRDASGASVPHVAVGTTDATVRTFRAGDLEPGPESDHLAPARPINEAVAETPSVAVAPDGLPPATAQFLYVAVDNEVAPEGTTVHKLSQEGNTLELAERAESELLEGAPAPALAVGQKAAPEGPTDGKLVVTTDAGLFTLNTSDLGGVQAGPETPFAENVALVSGPFAYVAADDGRQFVLRLDDAQPVAEGDFRPQGSAASASGQPSLSRGFVQVGTAAGLFVYRNRDVVPPSTAVTAPAEGARVTGTISLSATASDARGIGSVSFLVDGKAVGTDTAPDGGSPFNAMSPATFSASLDTRTLADGEHTVVAEASDGTLAAMSPARRFTVANGTTGGSANGTTGGSPTPPGPIVEPSGPNRRVKARRITASLKPRRDRKAPFRFTVSGRVKPPAGLSRAQACAGGIVAVQYKTGRRTISTRRAKLSSSCRYRSTVRFKRRKRFVGRSKLSVRVRFLGSDRLKPQKVRRLAPRVR